MADPHDNRSGASATQPYPARKIVWSALVLYWRYPALFLLLGAIVIVPYDLVVLVVTEGGPYQGDSSGLASGLLTVGDVVWVTPVISALHIHAVSAIRRGEKPRPRSVAAAGFRTLRFVIPATVVSGGLIQLTFSAGEITPSLYVLAVVGVMLSLRWFVVAQAASIERLPWLRPLGRSAELTSDNWGHIFVFGLLIGLIIVPPFLAFTIVLHGHSTTPGSFLGGLLIHTGTASFAALASALLYYDLRLRHKATSSELHAAPQPA
jgi:hypothetical protein